MNMIILAITVASQLLTQMAAPNAALTSYEVPVHFDVDLHSFLEMHTALDGTAYFRQPDKSAVDFNTVPLVADAFKHLAGTLGTPATWDQTYDVTLVSPNELQLVPKVSGNVAKVVVDVDPTTFGITRERFNYKNGGSIDIHQSNAQVGGFLLARTQTADFDLPNYKAHVVSTYGAYKLNVAIPDSVFNK
jgi:hypothetical protein